MENYKKLEIDLKENPEQRRLIELLESDKYKGKIKDVIVTRSKSDPDLVTICTKKTRRHVKAFNYAVLGSKKKSSVKDNAYISILL